MPEMSVVSIETAYKGKVGLERRAFCSAFIEKKQDAFRRLERDVFAKIESNGERVTCHKGCSACCVAYIQASIQECEAIVYYLYENPTTLDSFLERYSRWRERMRSLGNPFLRCDEVLHQQYQGELSQSDQGILLGALSLYQEQDIPCCFLSDGACSIYSVRPYACVNHYVTTPAAWCRAGDWCEPQSPHRPRIYMTGVDDLYDISFYHENLRRPIVGFMPTMVYRILTGGLEYIAELTGFERLSAKG